jgi:peroxiredoxin
VVAITVDDLALSKSVASQLHLDFPIVEDRDHRLGSALGVFRIPGVMDMGPVDNHAVFVVDATGHVRWKDVAAETMHVPVDAILSALREA